MRCTLAFVLILFTPMLYAQPLDSSSFDFWIGEWNLTWHDQSGMEHVGSNRVEKILDGKVIQENFSDPVSGFRGKSWSTWNPKTKTWRQVWTDNQSSFLEFTGESYDDTLVFVTEPAVVNGKNVIRRMIFYNIQEDSFNWDWQSAPEGTNDWTLLWGIRYERKPTPENGPPVQPE